MLVVQSAGRSALAVRSSSQLVGSDCRRGGFYGTAAQEDCATAVTRDRDSDLRERTYCALRSHWLILSTAVVR